MLHIAAGSRVLSSRQVIKLAGGIGFLLLFLTAYQYKYTHFIAVISFSANYVERNSDLFGTTVLTRFSNVTLPAPGVVLYPIGGIGNQLFQFACSYAIAREKSWPLYVRLQEDNYPDRQFSSNKREWSLDQFRIPQINIFDDTCMFSRLRNIWDDDYLDKKFGDADTIYLRGYCQSEAYWVEYRKELTEMLQPSSKLIMPTLSSAGKRILGDIENTESVAVHIRRGDLLLEVNEPLLIPITFHRVAVQRMCRLLKEKGIKTPPTFFLFSDDIAYAKKQLRDLEDIYKFVYVSDLRTTSLQDFLMMTRCKHIILPNSTFSWWAAYLNQNRNRTVIASAFNPEFWRNLGIRRIQGTLYHLSDWTVIDVFAGEIE